jgi:hypothetical protein
MASASVKISCPMTIKDHITVKVSGNLQKVMKPVRDCAGSAVLRLWGFIDTLASAELSDVRHPMRRWLDQFGPAVRTAQVLQSKLLSDFTDFNDSEFSS